MIRSFAKAMEYMRGPITAIISDVRNLTIAFFALWSNVGSTKRNIITLFAGIVDFVTLPFRTMISAMLGMVDYALNSLADKMRPVNSMMTGKIEAAAAAFRGARDLVDEGFLATTKIIGGSSAVKIEVAGEIDATVAQPIEIDGEKVGESISKVTVRARNAGRGGNPVSPEEMGFVLEGGTRIQPVNFSDVASEL
jgi:hypothetical protein